MIDVLVVGAGPAGSIAAALLAREGVRVLIVDRARFPREKLCGDSLNPGALDLLERHRVAAGLEESSLRITGMIVSLRGVRVAGVYPQGQYGLTITRRDLDAHLVAAAVAAGAQLQEEATVRAALMGEGSAGREVRGGTISLAGGKSIRLPARVTIAADGRHSTLAFALGLARHPRRPRRWAIGAYFEGVDGLSTYGEMHIRRRHYMGVAPLRGGLANACLVTEELVGFEDPGARLLSTLVSDSMLGDRFAQARLARPPTVIGPLAVEARAPGMPGLLLAGDAAGFIDPMTGDGLRFAIRGGELAARAALAMLEHGPAAGSRLLDKWRRAEFGGKRRLNRALRALVGSPAGVRVASVGAAIVPSVLRELIRIAGDVA